MLNLATYREVITRSAARQIPNCLQSKTSVALREEHLKQDIGYIAATEKEEGYFFVINEKRMVLLKGDSYREMNLVTEEQQQYNLMSRDNYYMFRENIGWMLSTFLEHANILNEKLRVLENYTNNLEKIVAKKMPDEFCVSDAQN